MPLTSSIEFPSSPPEEFTKGQRGHLRIESMQALLSEPDPPLAWLIEGLWVDKARGFIAGHPGVGKTWVALDMILSVATGGLCMGKYKPAYKAPCLLVEEEASRLNLQRRIHSLARGRGLPPEALASVFHITRQFARVPRDCDELISIVKANGIKLVVFDSLRAVHSAKENSSDDMQPVLDAFGLLALRGDCSVILIHHLAKSGVENAGKPIFERMRGSGSMWAWRDCVIAVEGEEDADTATLSFQFRDAESPAPLQVKRHVGKMSGAIGLQAVSLDESEDFIEKSTQIVTFVRSQLEPPSRNTICKAIEGRKADNLKIIKRMEHLGQLQKSGLGLLVPELYGTGGNHGNH